jgi:hypothetical protein
LSLGGGEPFLFRLFCLSLDQVRARSGLDMADYIDRMPR